MLTATTTKASSKTIRAMDTAFSIAQMAQFMRVSGPMISSMAKVRLTGQMGAAMLATITRAGAMELAPTSGATRMNIAASGRTML